MNLINGVFFKAFQITSVESFKSKDVDIYYKKIFGLYSSFMIIIASIFIIVLESFIKLTLEHSYYTAWKYSGILFLAGIFYCFSNFFSTIFISAKLTKILSISSFVGGIANLVLNFILIHIYGILGACIATLISYFLMFLIRIISSRKIIKFDIRAKENIISILLIVIQIIISNSSILIRNKITINSIVFVFIVCTNIFKIINIFELRTLREIINTLKNIRKLL